VEREKVDGGDGGGGDVEADGSGDDECDGVELAKETVVGMEAARTKENNGMEMDGMAAIKYFSILTTIRLVRLRPQRRMDGRSCEEADRV